MVGMRPLKKVHAKKVVREKCVFVSYIYLNVLSLPRES